jgi:NADP-dependent 3-hydroxy acid dehydrogenase YdfG
MERRANDQRRRPTMTTPSHVTTRDTPFLAGRVVLVTGASRSIGAATAALLARHGAAVAVNYGHDERAADQVVDAIVADGGRAIALQADVLPSGSRSRRWSTGRRIRSAP